MKLYVGRKGISNKEIWGFRLSTNRGAMITQRIIRGNSILRTNSGVRPASINEKGILCYTWALHNVVNRLQSGGLDEVLTNEFDLTMIYTNFTIKKWFETEKPPVSARVLCSEMFEVLEQLPLGVRLVCSKNNPVLPLLCMDNIEKEKYESVTSLFADLK